jgi:hypothetical protein
MEMRRWRRTGPVGTAVSLKTRGAGDLAEAWHRRAKQPPAAGPGESEEADRWDPAAEFFFGLKHF